ncbi:Mobilization protein MobA [Pasteurella multocida]|uniref:MobA n=2 Tax=Pasteurellaceae TaxID=712 RepID=C0JK71_PASMD|nr:MobA [Pasteurella multocida]NNI32189.1 Mobilization protein MobA [Pasteurella multocida]NNI62528.1 Mobilization protein MobA [Pasteurella multocida]QBF53207.1 MobA [Glaesserella parasuis]
MIVKFFKKHGKGKASSCKACVDYLLNKPDDTAQILQGDPRLSQSIADSLDFNNTYTAGCLSFEESDLPESQKREIMARFEKAMFAGLEPEQYNIAWVQHTDKGRLELNFVIPNVEMTSGKRLQPYYDRADRPLAENFKQVINHEYSLSDPNDPTKQKSLIDRKDLPTDKKQALQAITDGLTALANAGHINDRQDVINALERAGFEIARITPKNLSIRTDGQNLRLKGAFYEQDFRFSNDLSADITERAREHKRDSAERYQTARAKLDTAITARREQFSRKYPNRAGEIDKKHRQNVSFADPNRLDDISLDSHNRRCFDVAGEERLSRDDRMATLSRNSQRTEWGDQAIDLPNGQGDKTVHSVRQGFNNENVGREPESNRSPRNQETGEKINGDRTRTTLRENLENLARTARNRASEIIERIRELASRKRLDTTTIQRNNASIEEFKQHVEEIGQKVQAQKQQNRGMSL